MSEKMDSYLSLFGIPQELQDKACLDLSNLGPEFSLMLQKRGAACVVRPPGLSSSSNMEALSSVAGQFDYIFAFMDLFFDSDLEQFRCFLISHLKANGLLCVESTISGSLFEQRWTVMVVDQHVRFVPTFREIAEELLSGFSVRDIGRVPVGLRPSPTSAFFCRLLKPMVLLIGGRSAVGKTTFGRELARHGIRVLSLDFLYSEILYQAKISAPETFKELQARLDPSKIGTSIDKMVEDGFCEYLVDLSIPYFKTSEGLTVAEGYQFSIPQLLQMTREKLTVKNFRVETLILG
jgi:hypothetical protein